MNIKTLPISKDTELRTQAVVIGSGAGGATTALMLAEAGIDVLILEEGEHFEKADFSASVPSLIEKLYRDSALTPILGRPNIAFGEGRCLGGSTVINGALFRRPPAELLDDWSKKYGISDVNGPRMNARFERLEKDLNASTQPQKSVNIGTWRIVEAAEKLKWQTELLPRAQNACQNSNRCPTGCPNDAKQSMLVSYLPRASNLGARIVCNSTAKKLLRSGNRITGVEAIYQDQNITHKMTIKADAVFLCCGPTQTPAFLLNNGLRGRVGKTLQLHFNLRAVAIFNQGFNPKNGTIMSAAVTEFSDRGVHIGTSNFDLPYLAASLTPQRVSVAENVLNNWANAAMYVAQIKAQGRGEIRNSMLLGKAAAHYSISTADMEVIRFSILQMSKLLFNSGARELYFPITHSGPIRSEQEAIEFVTSLSNPKTLHLVSVHAMSSCAMGIEPDSVANQFGQVRNFENLYINDASMLPEATSVNPQMSIMAMAMRNCEAYLENNRHSSS